MKFSKYSSILIVSFIAILMVISYSLRVQAGIITPEPSLQDFRLSLSNIVNQSNALTAAYQDEIGKWESHQYDNATLASVTDSYLPKFESLVNKAQNLTYPADYKNVHDALVNSLRSETDSNKYFRDYLLSGNETENEISIDLFSKAYQYEQVYSKFLADSLPANENKTIV